MKLGLLHLGLFLILVISIEGKRRSFGGKYARDGQFPYVALLSYGGRKHCGASIIHERWAVTAGHCLFDDEKKPLLTVGTTGDLGSGVSYEIEKFHVHRDYTVIPEEENEDLEYVVNDIGLIRTSSKIVFSPTVQPIALATDEDNSYEHSMATMTGWGAAAYGRSMHEHLRYINVRVISFDECKSVWIYADKHLCTSNKEHRGPCYGDSGSPLVVDGVQIGIVSTADTYCEELKPDLYTKVASFIPWIESILSKYGDTL